MFNNFKGTAMQIEKALINDRLCVSFQLFIEITREICYFLKK